MERERSATVNIRSVLMKHFPDLKTVRDARAGTMIEVTARDEAKAKKKRHKECAMALACQRKMSLDGVLISRSRAYLVKDGVATRYDLSMAAQKEVVSFDRGGGFDQGEYDLLKPAHKLGGGGGGKGIHSSTAKMGKPKHITGKIRTAIR